MDVYFISGLGADERVFSKLVLPSRFRVHHIAWIEPLPREDLSHYCQRLSDAIDTTREFALVGMSLGGVVAIELNRFLHPAKTIIISSVTSEREYSFLFKLLALLRIQKFIPLALLRIPNPLAYWFFSTKLKEEKAMLKYFMKTVSNNYFRWSMNVVLTWKNDFTPPNLYHIQGTADHIFPIKKSPARFRIKNGGHLMVYDRAKEISEIITQILSGRNDSTTGSATVTS